MSQNYQAFLDECCEKLGTNHNVNSFSICSFLLKEQLLWLFLFKKTFTNAGHIDAKLIDFSETCQKNPAKSWILVKIPPEILPWYQLIFITICPWKSFKNWLFSAKVPQNWQIFLQILTFLPRNRPTVPRILTFFPQKSCEIGRFSREFAPENPAKFCFFSAKYQKPWIKPTSKTLTLCAIRKINNKKYTFADSTRALLTARFMLSKLANISEKGPISFMK